MTFSNFTIEAVDVAIVLGVIFSCHVAEISEVLPSFFAVFDSFLISFSVHEEAGEIHKRAKRIGLCP